MLSFDAFSCFLMLLKDPAYAFHPYRHGLYGYLCLERLHLASGMWSASGGSFLGSRYFVDFSRRILAKINFLSRKSSILIVQWQSWSKKHREIIRNHENRLDGIKVMAILNILKNFGLKAHYSTSPRMGPQSRNHMCVSLHHMIQLRNLIITNMPFP